VKFTANDGTPNTIFSNGRLAEEFQRLTPMVPPTGPPSRIRVHHESKSSVRGSDIEDEVADLGAEAEDGCETASLDKP
jgi:hypothetical protein